MSWDLPYSVTIGDESYSIRNRCDYRVVLGAIKALTDEDYEPRDRIYNALIVFYEDISKCTDAMAAYDAMAKIIRGGDDREEPESDNKPQLMDWEYDFKYIAPPVSRVLGYDVRDPERSTHWYSFLGAYMEIGECTLATIISIRSKRAKGKKLEKWEEEFYKNHRKDIILPQKITAVEREILEGQW